MKFTYKIATDLYPYIYIYVSNFQSKMMEDYKHLLSLQTKFCQKKRNNDYIKI